MGCVERRPARGPSPLDSKGHARVPRRRPILCERSGLVRTTSGVSRPHGAPANAIVRQLPRLDASRCADQRTSCNRASLIEFAIISAVWLRLLRIPLIRRPYQKWSTAASAAPQSHRLALVNDSCGIGVSDVASARWRPVAAVLMTSRSSVASSMHHCNYMSLWRDVPAFVFQRIRAGIRACHLFPFERSSNHSSSSRQQRLRSHASHLLCSSNLGRSP